MLLYVLRSPLERWWVSERKLWTQPIYMKRRHRCSVFEPLFRSTGKQFCRNPSCQAGVDTKADIFHPHAKFHRPLHRTLPELLSIIVSPPVYSSMFAVYNIFEHGDQDCHVQWYLCPFVNLGMGADVDREAMGWWECRWRKGERVAGAVIR